MGEIINMKNKYFYNMSAFVFILIITGVCFGQKGFCATHRVPDQYVSIQKALNAAVPGDKIQVAAGTYYEHITLKKGVLLEGAWNNDFSKRDLSSFETLLDGEKEKGAVVKCADDATLDGFTVIHGSLLKTDDISEGSGIYCEKTSTIITNNTIRDNEPSGIFCEGGTATISKNHIFENAQAGIYVTKGSFLKASKNRIHNNKYSGIGSGKLPVSEFDIRNNTIYKNERSGINAQTASGSVQNNILYGNKHSGIRCTVAPFTIINNTVVANSQAGVWVEDPEVVATIKNNIFTHNIDAGIRTSGTGFSNNLFFANGETGACNPEYLWCVKPQYGGYGDEKSYKRNGGIIADPLFVDMAAHDFHLQGGSPAIDGGDKDKVFSDTQFPPSLGTDRNDMGAYGGPLAIAEKRGKNNAPVASAGSDKIVDKGERVILDARKSSDPDGDALKYQWTLISSPESSKAKLLKADSARSMCRTDKPGVYKVRLVVTDRLGLASKPAVIKITVSANTPPKANIGELISQVSAGDTITLYGSASKDPDGDPLTYKWSLIFKPDNSSATIADATSQNSTLQVDVDGGYTIQLLVNDGKTDSEPEVVHISTRTPVQEGVRNVPGEYPTIQAAIDAAQAGDDIVVQKRVYTELLVIDKSVNLIGKDWPVIDGGSQEGNRNTISFFYLGDRAGKIEGFVITGGGLGDLGHGINVWDSAPDIFNNKITGNNHGIGIHGSPSLTGKAKVHGNLIFDNHVGIGNGKDSTARIYNNRIYNNHIVGIGSRGKGAPRIEANYIYNNRLGIGAREVASPRIIGNHIFNNTDGIVISPLSTIKKFMFEDIVIDNNLIVGNDHLGVNITSFNLSKVIITNNTIDSNNKLERKIRGGGVVLGYPQPASYTAVVEGNIITNNKGAGIINYIGSENFTQPGVTLINKKNNVWRNTVDYLDCKTGENSSSNDPAFISTDVQTPGTYKTGQTAESSITGYSHSAAAFAELPAEEE